MASLACGEGREGGIVVNAHKIVQFEGALPRICKSTFADIVYELAYERGLSISQAGPLRK